MRPTLEVLATRYKLGIASNNNPIQEALRRDGLLDYFNVVATPETSGADKTDAAFWRWAQPTAVVTSFSMISAGWITMARLRTWLGLTALQRLVQCVAGRQSGEPSTSASGAESRSS